MKEKRIFGPPGTGKTTHLATHVVPRASERFGADRVVVTSFTRTAAKEIAQKKSLETGETIPIDLANVGTLHALIYRALESPELATTHLDQWNNEHPYFEISNGAKGNVNDLSTVVDSGGGGLDGDILLNESDKFRAKMIPTERWPRLVLDFYAKWSEWKSECGYMDFTDLIEYGLKEMIYAPGQPSVIIVDEAQDFTLLQLTTLRQWAQHAEWLALVGDDEQCLFAFAGATPDSFLNPPIDARFKQVLSQSYRVPRAVHAFALTISNRIRRREPKEYFPRDFDGDVSRCPEYYADPDIVVKHAMDCMGANKSVMILASCSYMLEPVIKRLRESGIPFGNKYRRKRGDWNPLNRDTNGTSASDLLLSFLSTGEDGAYWDVPNLLRWAEYLSVSESGLIRGKGNKGIVALKQAVEQDAGGLHSARNVLTQILSPAAVERALARDTEWLIANLKTVRQKGIMYPAKVLSKFGKEAIEKEPLLTVGTIHSVKGAEADTVFMYPDISFKAKATLAIDPGDFADSLYRMFYVGATRAKEQLVVMAPSPQRGGYNYIEL